jgi:hypothetical protein
MIRRLSLAAILLLTVIFSRTIISRANELPVIYSTSYTLNCNSLTVSGNFDSSGYLDIDVDDITTNIRIADNDEDGQGAFAPYTRTVSFSDNYNIGDLIEIYISDASDSSVDVFTTIPNCGTCTWSAGDDRLNKCDSGQTAAVYCLSDGSVKVMSIHSDSKGYLAFIASPTDIAKVSAKPAINTPIMSGDGATLYRLTSGELQVNRAEALAGNATGKSYQFIFKCGSR